MVTITGTGKLTDAGVEFFKTLFDEAAAIPFEAAFVVDGKVVARADARPTEDGRLELSVVS